MSQQLNFAQYFTRKILLRFVYFYSTCSVVSNYCGGIVFLSGDSMLPTIEDGDVVITKTFRPRKHGLNKGEIYCVKSPVDSGVLLCKRVALLEHEKVELPLNMFPSARVSSGHCFLLGDNSEASTDSRHFGPVPVGLVHSKVLLRVWPPNRFGWLN
uniref:Mitochondrial inner membrane protease subunit n=1 Tax=Panagrolaimus sp. JU765 TaxID=591449 RepID=A0AC34RSB8_9BILA